MQFWKYSKVALNKSLKTSGLIGSQRPDVIGITNDGHSLLIEVLSKYQFYEKMQLKCEDMALINVGQNEIKYHIIKWVKYISKVFK